MPTTIPYPVTLANGDQVAFPGPARVVGLEINGGATGATITITDGLETGGGVTAVNVVPPVVIPNGAVPTYIPFKGAVAYNGVHVNLSAAYNCRLLVEAR